MAEKCKKSSIATKQIKTKKNLVVLSDYFYFTLLKLIVM